MLNENVIGTLMPQKKILVKRATYVNIPQPIASEWEE